MEGGGRTESGEKGGEPERKARAGRGAGKGIGEPGCERKWAGDGARLGREEKWERRGSEAGRRGRGTSRLCFPSPSTGR